MFFPKLRQDQDADSLRPPVYACVLYIQEYFPLAQDGTVHLLQQHLQIQSVSIASIHFASPGIPVEICHLSSLSAVIGKLYRLMPEAHAMIFSSLWKNKWIVPFFPKMLNFEVLINRFSIIPVLQDHSWKIGLNCFHSPPPSKAHAPQAG